ncbi:MAG: glycerol acyltransferase [Bacteroidales bacterium]|nr:glycerol acyltransferase [Bacteroidales bacterium]
MEYEKTEKIGKNFIDIDEVFRQKNPSLLKILPKFILRIIKRIVHQKELNAALYKNRDYFGTDFVDTVLKHFEINIETKGEKYVPKEGRVTLASNHPLGGLDGMALIKAIDKYRSDIVVPANDILMTIPNLRPIFIPVNKHGSNATNIKIMNDTFASDIIMLYFPAGLVSRKQKGIIKDLEWKKTFLSKSKYYKRDIIPIHINGRNTNFFYYLAKLRGFLRIKSNIEMFLLVDEMFRQKNQKIIITFGKPVSIDFFDKRNSDLKWANLLRDYVYELEKDNELSFEQWYENKSELSENSPKN